MLSHRNRLLIGHGAVVDEDVNAERGEGHQRHDDRQPAIGRAIAWSCGPCAEERRDKVSARCEIAATRAGHCVPSLRGGDNDTTSLWIFCVRPFPLALAGFHALAGEIVGYA